MTEQNVRTFPDVLPPPSAGFKYLTYGGLSAEQIDRLLSAPWFGEWTREMNKAWQEALWNDYSRVKEEIVCKIMRREP